jgi:hypothetical protein
MSEYPNQNKQDTLQMIWTKRLFVLSLVLLGIVFSLQGVGIIEFPVDSTTSQRKKVKPIRVGGLLCQEPVWNFGAVDSIKNSRLSHEFTLVNESKETVTIQKIHSTCGCMVAEDFDKELFPGKSTKIKVNVQLPPTPQLFHKNLAIQTNIGVLPLDVRGEIAANSSMFCVPAKVNFGEIRLGETKERQIQIFRYDLSQIQFEKVEGQQKEIVCEIIDYLEPKVTINVRLIVDQSPLGQLETSITIYTSHKVFPELKIPVIAYVVGEKENQYLH